MKPLLLSLVAAAAALAGGAAYAQPLGYVYVEPQPQTTPWQAVPGYSETYEGRPGNVYIYGGVPIYSGVPIHQQRDLYAQRGRDRDRDGVPDRYDNDRDNDGVPNYLDRRPNDSRRR